MKKQHKKKPFDSYCSSFLDHAYGNHRCPKFPLVGWVMEGLGCCPLATGFMMIHGIPVTGPSTYFYQTDIVGNHQIIDVFWGITSISSTGAVTYPPLTSPRVLRRWKHLEPEETEETSRPQVGRDGKSLDFRWINKITNDLNILSVEKTHFII